MKNMRLWCGMLALALAPGWAEAAPLKVKITKTTLHKRQSQAQERSRGSTQLEEKRVACRFEIQQPGSPPGTRIQFEWTILVEGANGRLQPGADGFQPVVFSNTMPVVVESAPLMLVERTWQGGPRSGSMESSIAGIGWRAWDGQGNLLGEDYDPPSIRVEINWNRAGKSAPDPGPAENDPPLRRPAPRRNALPDP